MTINRIRDFESVWDAQDSSKPPSVDLPATVDIPPGFVSIPLQNLSPEQQLKLPQSNMLYQMAYRLAKEQIDRTFFNDWMI